MCTLHLEEEEITVTQDPCTCYTEEECGAAYPYSAPDEDAVNANSPSDDVSNVAEQSAGDSDSSSTDDRDRGLGKSAPFVFMHPMYQN